MVTNQNAGVFCLIIGIAATAAQRQEPLKWYERYKRHRPVYYRLDGYKLTAAVVYGTDLKARRSLLESGASVFLKSEGFPCGVWQGFPFYDGRQVLLELVPDIIRKISKMKGRTPETLSVAVLDDCFGNDARSFAAYCAKHFQYLSVLSASDEAEAFAGSLFDEYGLIAQVNPCAPVQADFAVRTGPGNFELEKSTILIDCFDVNNNEKPLHRPSINGAQLDLEQPFHFRLPTLALAQAIRECGIQLPPLRVTGLCCGGDRVTAF